MNIHAAAILSLLALPAVSGNVCENRELDENGTSDRVKLHVKPAPPLPGVAQRAVPKVILAQETNYPPYTKLNDDLEITGFGPDFANALKTVCDIEIVLVETDWDECWTKNATIGRGLAEGTFHGCSTYTGIKGVRQRYLEFSAPILSKNKAAGILTRLENGVPVVDGSSNLSGVTVGDVTGWAPTADTLEITVNQCTGALFKDFTFHDQKSDPLFNPSTNENDMALTFLLEGSVDAVWIYADQVAQYKKGCDKDPNQKWDCDLWSRFGTDFAYVQTGIFDYMIVGTTLAMSKKGSGLKDTLDPCIKALIETRSYKEICEKWGLVDSCFQNDYFDPPSGKVPPTAPYNLPTDQLTTTCADGYCPCPP